MAGRGRGRGRGLVIMKPTPPGGGSDAEVKVETTAKRESPTTQRESRPLQALNDLKSELTSVLSEKDDLTDDEIQRIEQLVVIAGDVQEATKVLYNCVKTKKSSAKAVALIYDRLSALDPDGTHYRSAILRMVQEDYKDREQLKASSCEAFLSCVSMLSHLFVTLRLANGEAMQALVGPIYDCLEMTSMTEGMGDSEAETFNTLLQLIGRELQDNADDRMQDLMMNVRSRIIEQTTKPQVRCYLLEVLESYARRWQLAPNDITRFYIDVNIDIIAGLVISNS
ncbi:hypothetical protein ACOMHN_022367 [Nucella lapillus]